MKHNSCFHWLSSSLTMLLFILICGLSLPQSASAQKPEWQINVDWPATNTGVVDCPDQYLANGVPWAIWPDLGRAEAIRVALFAIRHGDYGRAWNLVLMTQCHNRHAQQTLIYAGQQAVISYLADNWTPNGVDPYVVIPVVAEAFKTIAGAKDPPGRRDH